MLHRIFQSSFLIIILFLLLIDCGIKYGKPLRYVTMGGYIPSDQDPIGDKYESLKAESQKSRILLLGSSLPMFAAICADYRVGELSAATTGYETYTYTKAKYLQSLLRKLTHEDLPVFNFSASGCMVSDSYIALEQSIANGMHPKVAIFALAPRDFLDNFARPTKETGFFKFFKKDNHNAFNWKTFNHEESFNNFIGSIWVYYKLKPDYRTFFLLATTDAFHRAPTLYSALHYDPGITKNHIRLAAWDPPEMADIPGDEDKRLKDLNSYKKSYYPINQSRFNDELGYLEKSLELCRKHAILPIVVNMPRIARNQAILPDWFQTQYTDALTKSTKKYGCPFFDLNSEPIFVESDFRDSVHLNGDGSLKVFNLLAAKLSKDDRFMTAIKDEKQLSLR
ncbi:MAG: DUF1574 domain-containing protein [Candidatus Obscuribacterales bacterium]|nr:DUF1574 domain-containing protein [Candidatus Obscuribacterales bacterium]